MRQGLSTVAGRVLLRMAHALGRWEPVPELAALPADVRRRVWKRCLSVATSRWAFWWRAAVLFGSILLLSSGAGELVDYTAPSLARALRTVVGLVEALAFAVGFHLLVARSSMEEIRRQIGGVCVHCGYDIRATPDRCPECGAVPKGEA